MKKISALLAAILFLVILTPLRAQEGSVMTIRVCDIDTMNAGDTSILGYVFMEQYKLDDYQEEAYMKVYKPTMEEVRKAEKLLRSKYFSIMSPERRDRFGKEDRPRLKTYTRQYIFGIDAEGKLYVWVNAIKNNEYDPVELKKGLVCVRDGGNYFWHTLLNISDGKVLSVTVNGEA